MLANMWDSNRGRLAAILVFALSLLMGGCDLEPGKVDRIVQAEDATPQTIATASGPVVGRKSAAGQAFLGIPYAAAPVGPLRWRAPQPVAPWSEPRPAIRLGASCPQNLSLDAQTGQKGNGPILGAEDCLTLNVYAPAGAASPDRRPVMVWIYGGAFMLGASGQYDPSRLVEATGNIVVTFNYRQGALGFLAHPALNGEAGEGAFALLDQQAALRWVRSNIGGFGGDPHKVTLFGQSAGAWSVCYQLTSPGAAGLFQRAILQSGACTTPETSLSLQEAEAGGEQFAADLGCGTADALECLRGKPAAEIMKALPQRRGVTGPNSWAPVTGLDVLPVPPRAAFESGRFNRVPVIQGSNRDEGRLFSYLRAYRGDLWSEQSYKDIIAQMFGPRAGAILARYPAASFGSPGLAYAAVLTDSLFACASLTLDRLLQGHTAVYAYEFDDPQAPFSLPRAPWAEPVKAYHAAEIPYVFGSGWPLADAADFDANQMELSTRIQTYWGSFARTGDPEGEGAPSWPRFTHGPESIEALTSAGIGATEDFSARHSCGFWGPLGY